MKKDKTIEKLTVLMIKNLGLDEPSADFTVKVMQSIALEAQPEYLVQRNYWWLLGLIPVFTAISWYFIVLFRLSGYVIQFLTSFLTIVQPFIAQFLSLFTQLKNLSISPLLLIGFIAVLSLLTIEELATRIKRSS